MVHGTHGTHGNRDGSDGSGGTCIHTIQMTLVSLVAQIKLLNDTLESSHCLILALMERVGGQVAIPCRELNNIDGKYRLKLDNAGGLLTVKLCTV